MAKVIATVEVYVPEDAADFNLDGVIAELTDALCDEFNVAESAVYVTSLEVRADGCPADGR